MARSQHWRLGVTTALLASVFGLLMSGCGTFEVRGQLVTPTATLATVPTKTPITLVSPTTEASTAATNTPEPTNPLPQTSQPDRLDVPRLDDAQVIVDIGTRLIYRSESDLEDALAFYESQMPLEGWTQISETSSETDALFTFQRGDETVTITITEDWLGLTVEVESQS